MPLSGMTARPFASGDDLVKMANHDGIPIWQLMLENEMAWRTESEIRAGVARIWQVMRDCTKRGLETGGILAGGLSAGALVDTGRRLQPNPPYSLQHA